LTRERSDKKGGARLPRRKSGPALFLLGAGALLLGLMFAHAGLQRRADMPLLESPAGMVGRLELTDLCLFTEARYTRHPSQADLHSAFQDHPVALEHFPAGSMGRTPSGLRRLHAALD